MSFITRGVRLITVLATLTLAACASYSPDYQALNQPSDLEYVELLPVDADIAELIHYAQRHHPSVKAAEAELERARAAAVSAGSFADPQLDLTHGLNDTSYLTVGVMQEIPVFGRRAMTIEQARAAKRVAEANLVQVKAELASNVVQAFSEYLYVVETQGLQQELIQLLEQFSTVAGHSYATGAVAMPDLLRAQNALDEARNEQQNLSHMLFSQRARLNSALGRDARTKFEGDYSLQRSHKAFAHLPAQPEHLYNLLDEHSPALMAARSEAEMLLVGKDLAGTAGLPRFMVGAEYMAGDMASDTVAGMFSVSLPIWRSNYRALREAAEASVRSGLQQLHSTELAIQAELSMALYEWQQAERNRQLYGDVLITRAGRAVASNLTNYQSGNAGFTDVISSQREWLSFELAYRRALANQLAAVARIHALVPSVAQIEVDHD